MSNELAMMNCEETLQSVMHALQRTVDLPSEQREVLAQVTVLLVQSREGIAMLKREQKRLLMYPACTASTLNEEHMAGTVGYRALHGKNIECPIHGTPEPGKRLRPRTKQCDVGKIRKAIDRWQQVESLGREIVELGSRVDQVERQLEALLEVGVLELSPKEPVG